ncbi:hypothetical protein [Streptomyces roseolus]|uniref:hypothetical protein n=1 Tax=Streptomyces roseolus TaxID=67358 RepID=UPI0019A6CCB3|nr:hypothetical protein [Streptomyces roseolus]GGR13542.1 hypothetical protein GCM10010282_02400 [Streptomyces roseolus]
MTGRRTPHLPSEGPELRLAVPFAPRLGDLAADTAHSGHVGVVVALPGEDSATTYHLRPPGGGPTWSAPADGSTLLPVPAQITHATLLTSGDAVYDPRTNQGSLPIVFHFADGSTSEGALVLAPAELERLHAQTGRLLASHDKASGLV